MNIHIFPSKLFIIFLSHFEKYFYYFVYFFHKCTTYFILFLHISFSDTKTQSVPQYAIVLLHILFILWNITNYRFYPVLLELIISIHAIKFLFALLRLLYHIIIDLKRYLLHSLYLLNTLSRDNVWSDTDNRNLIIEVGFTVFLVKRKK